MQTRYSPSKESFYPFDIDYGNALPSDAVTVDRSIYDAAMERPAGTVFDLHNGELIITDMPSAPFAPQATAYLGSLRAERERTLNRITGIAVATESDAVRAACRVARQNLLDVTSAPAVLAATTMDDLRAAVEAAYSHIVDSVPVELRSAFD